ncbi:MAG: hypothetical protein KTR32_18965 [Granulosicoccus sp.]|nr:hypothetical protein [Granulosicoccus sp.]
MTPLKLNVTLLNELELPAGTHYLRAIFDENSAWIELSVLAIPMIFAVVRWLSNVSNRQKQNARDKKMAEKLARLEKEIQELNRNSQSGLSALILMFVFALVVSFIIWIGS